MRQPSPCARACASVLHSCRPGTWPACDHLALQGQAKIFFTLHSAVFTSCTSRATRHVISSYTSATFFTQQTFTQKGFYTQKLLHRTIFTHDFPNNLQLQNRISTQEPKKARFWSFSSRTFNRKITSAKMQKIWLKNHHRDLLAAIPIQFTMFICKRQ